MTSETTLDSFQTDYPSRAHRILKEFQFAVAQMNERDLKALARELPRVIATISARRMKNLGRGFKQLANLGANEAKSFATAIREKRTKGHTISRVSDLKDWSSEKARDALVISRFICQRIAANPKEEAPKVMAFILGVSLGSGGLDGDGGVPDLDLLGGIGAHRSVLTHSIVSGIIIEATALIMLRLSEQISDRLPPTRDPLWDLMVRQRDDIVRFFTAGASLGIAYHLVIDGTIDSAGTYKDLPFAIPHIGHDAILWANAATEGLDGKERLTNRRSQRVSALRADTRG